MRRPGLGLGSCKNSPLSWCYLKDVLLFGGEYIEEFKLPLIFLLYFCSRYTCSEWNTTILHILKIFYMHGIPYYILKDTIDHTMLGTVSHNAMLSVWPFITSDE